jgi:methionyl-tRNA formyltransferase
MKIIFMGTPDFACPSLLSLIRSKYDIVGVITQPDRKRGRGMEVSFSPVKELSLKSNLNIYQPLNINDPEFINFLRKISPDLIVIVAFGRILSEEVLRLARYGCINLHPSLLPKYRGAAPIPWAILAGEERSGVTTFYLSEKVDISQDKEKATYAPRLKKEDGLIDWKKSASQIERLIRAMNPWPGAYTYIEVKSKNEKVKMKIWKVGVISDVRYQMSDIRQPGKVADITKEGRVIACGEGFLLVKEVQPPGKKRMSASSFASGYRIKKGSILGDKFEIRNPKH